MHLSVALTALVAGGEPPRADGRTARAACLPGGRGARHGRLLRAALGGLLLTALGAGGGRAADVIAGDLAIDGAWARATPPGISVGAVYLNITNHGATADRLIAVSSPQAQRGEIHETTTRAGVMSMRAVAGLACAPGATVKIGPGGVHIMLLGLKQSWLPGAQVPLTLTFEHAGSVPLTVPVRMGS